MKTIQVALTFVALAAAVAGSRAQAAIIYDNGAVTNGFGVSDAIGFVRADNFILSPGASTITGVEWTGIYGQGLVHVTDNFTIQFFENDPANPPTLDQPRDLPNFIVSIAVGNPNRTGAGVFHYSASIAPLALQPNTMYWVSIFNDSSDEPGTVWAWADQISTNNAELTALRGGQFPIWGSQTGLKMDFQLLGEGSAVSEVPEPATLILLIPGMLAILSRRPRGHPEESHTS